MKNSFFVVARFILIALPLCSLGLNAIFLVRWGVDLPFWDDWRQYNSGFLGSLDLGYLFTPVNDTLYPVGQWLDSIAFRWLGGHAVTYQLLSLIGILGGLLYLIWRLLGLMTQSQWLRALAFSFTLPLLQPGSYWGLQNLAYHQALPLLAVMWVLWLCLNPKTAHRLSTLIAVAALSLIAGLSYISGAFAMLMLSLVLWCVSPQSRRLAVAVFIPALLTTLVQAWVIVFYQQGMHLSQYPMTMPWHGDFWWYGLGKFGQALLFSKQVPEWSLIGVLLIVVVLLWLSWRLLRVERGTPLATVWFSLWGVVLIYLALVAAGRAAYRPDSLVSPLEVFAFGFERFHYFWITVCWPFAVIALSGTVEMLSTPFRKWARGVGTLLLGMLLAYWVLATPVLQHSAYYEDVMGLRQQGWLCLNEKIAQQAQPLACPPVHPTDEPELLPDDLSLAVREALTKGASFAQKLSFPPLPSNTELGRVIELSTLNSEQMQWVDLLLTGQNETGWQLQAVSAGDPSLSFQTQQIPLLQSCLILDVTVHLTTAQPDVLQFFYIPLGQTQLSEQNSKIVRVEQAGLHQVQLRLFSTTGFMDYFRLDPVTQAGLVKLHELELHCRF